ncbi:manganese-dependent inorganic pyrophosphatase [Budvicia diplopodorum]|uniref:manganese-dependent inorganic pyrophosphatase n=1 Tax=Budvicia diplopodorum TaxID=1119056 RepID=UPI00135A998F|nr:manganese-dependent inorganic pyrophosphatase [Budvicia diplopodorum]
MISVFGHLNPDSDSICSALVVTDWLNFLNRNAVAYRLGEINPETQFLLTQANLQPPTLLSHDIEGQDVWLVDFSELEQGPTGLEKSNVIGLIDHHRMGSLITAEPLDAWIRKVGCCGTIVFDIVSNQAGYTLSSAHSLLLLGAILSDTVGFQSPTTTDQDRTAAEALAVSANVNLADFTLSLLNAKTDISGLSIERLLQKDEKNYTIADNKMILAQIEVSSFAAIDDKIADLKAEMEKRVVTDKLDFYVLMVTSLSTSQSQIYFSNHNPVSQVPVLMENTISRKKQLLPWLTRALAE